MKTSKIFASVFAAVAMFMGNTEAKADNVYHASDVRYEVGVNSESFNLHKIGVTADSCEIWAAPKETDKYSYFYCYVDGTELSVPNTSIDDNVTHTLTELSWLEVPRLRQITSSSFNHTIFVKVKGKNSGESQLKVWDRDLENINKKVTDRKDWFLTGASVSIEPVGEPVYDAATDTYTQDMKWDAEGIPSCLWWGTEIYAQFDDSETWECVGTTYAFNPSHTIKVTVPGDVKQVKFGAQAVPYSEYQMVVNLDEWASPATKVFTLNKTSEAKGADFFDEQTTNGIDAIDTDTNANATVDIYNLAGMRVAQGTTLQEASSSLNHGVYVVNGKKVMLGK